MNATETTRQMAAVVVFVLALVACAGSPSHPLIFTDGDTGAEILVGSGDQFEIRLEANPSTGYGWVVAAESAPGIVSLRAERFETADQGLVGGPGKEVFTFEAMEAGAGIVRLEYIRPFDDPIIPERVAEFIVRVDGAPWPPPGF